VFVFVRVSIIMPHYICHGFVVYCETYIQCAYRASPSCRFQHTFHAMTEDTDYTMTDSVMVSLLRAVTHWIDIRCVAYCEMVLWVNSWCVFLRHMHAYNRLDQTRLDLIKIKEIDVLALAGSADNVINTVLT
jgi:hypothetical protein